MAGGMGNFGSHHGEGFPFPFPEDCIGVSGNGNG